MKLSFRKKVGLGGLLLLMASTQLAVSIRRDDWSELLQPSGWLWSIIPAAFMGGWGWITLYFSRAADTRGVHNGLIGLAIAYFATMSYFTFDIILNGNSTSGIAFFTSTSSFHSGHATLDWPHSYSWVQGRWGSN